jgi:hypothetical protein
MADIYNNMHLLHIITFIAYLSSQYYHHTTITIFVVVTVIYGDGAGVKCPSLLAEGVWFTHFYNEEVGSLAASICRRDLLRILQEESNSI